MIILNGEIVKTWRFPAGETGVNIHGCQVNKINNIRCNFENNDDIINLLFVVNAISYVEPKATNYLYIPYFPYARQDRVCSNGDPFSLKVIANLIKECNFEEVICVDLHSDVMIVLFEAGVLTSFKQHEVLEDFVSSVIAPGEKVALVAPDAGSLKKIYPLATKLNLNVIEAKKIRNTNTGKIISSYVDKGVIPCYNHLIIVDDICDGGRTFVELAKVIRENYDNKLTLVVTHGIFSNGMQELNRYFDNVLCYNDMRKKEK